MAPQKLRVGIAGYGLVGQKRRQFIDHHPCLKTTAISDQKFSESGKLPDGVKFFPDYRTLLEEPLDILFVSLPNYLAAEATMAGLEKGLHVFCEKPPGCSVTDIKNVMEVEKKHPGLKLKYGFNHRYHDSVREALRIVESGDLGTIINIRGVYGKSKIIPFHGEWRAERKYAGGGILLDQGIHMVDLMRLFCGEFEDVKSFISNSYWKHDVEDNAYALMRDSKGRIAFLHSSATQWQHRFSLEINLTEGYMELLGILSGSKSYGEEQLVIGRRDESATGTLHKEIKKYLEDNSWRDEINDFAENILSDVPIKSGTSADAYSTMKLVFMIYSEDQEWSSKFNIQNPNA